jgi:hypothetical protein
MELHAVLFDRNIYTPNTARTFLRSKDIKPIKRVNKENLLNLKYVITNKDKYNSFRSKFITDGIKYIFGKT